LTCFALGYDRRKEMLFSRDWARGCSRRCEHNSQISCICRMFAGDW